jgi:hypothetical protein
MDLGKVIHPKYSKHCLSTVAHTIACLYSKILNHGLTLPDMGSESKKNAHL